MRRMLLSSLIVFGAASTQAFGQTSNNPLLDSGTVVGTPILRSVGQAIPKVAPQVGNTVGTSPTGQPNTDATSPKVPFDLKNVVAPVNPEYLPPALRPAQNESLYDAAFKKWLMAFGLVKPPEVKTNNFTPGMSRRNRERHREREWWRD